MGKAKPLQVGSRHFAKRGDATAFYREILNRYEPGAWLNAADQAAVLELLERHPNRAAKVGVGIHHVEVQPADYRTQCFAIVRTDGTTEQFSYVVCISPERFQS